MFAETETLTGADPVLGSFFGVSCPSNLTRIVPFWATSARASPATARRPTASVTSAHLICFLLISSPPFCLSPERHGLACRGGGRAVARPEDYGDPEGE